MGQAAQQVVADNQGALQRSAEIIATFLPPSAMSSESDDALRGDSPRRRSS
jgi:hypothetical protein